MASPIESTLAAKITLLDQKLDLGFRNKISDLATALEFKTGSAVDGDTFRDTAGNSNRIYGVNTIEKEFAAGQEAKRQAADYVAETPRYGVPLGRDVYGRNLVTGFREHGLNMMAQGLGAPTRLSDDQGYNTYVQGAQQLQAAGKTEQLQQLTDAYDKTAQRESLVQQLSNAPNKAAASFMKFTRDLVDAGASAVGATYLDNLMSSSTLNDQAINEFTGVNSNQANQAKAVNVDWQAGNYGRAGLNAVTELGIGATANSAAEMAAYAIGWGGVAALVAKDTNKDLEQFEINNKGQSADASKIAEVTLLNIMKHSAGKLVQGAVFDGAVGSAKRALSALPLKARESFIAKLGAVAAGGSAGALGLGALEGVEEYVQSWVEILNQETGLDNKGSWLDQKLNKFGEQKAQWTATQGALEGFGSAGGIAGTKTAFDSTGVLAKGALESAPVQAGIKAVNDGFATANENTGSLGEPNASKPSTTASNVTYPTGYTKPSFDDQDAAYDPVAALDNTVSSFVEAAESRPDSLPLTERFESIIAQTDVYNKQREDALKLIADDNFIGLDPKEAAAFKNSVVAKLNEANNRRQDSLIALSTELDTMLKDPSYSANKSKVSSELLGSIDFGSLSNEDLQTTIDKIKPHLNELDLEIADTLLTLDGVSQDVRQLGNRPMDKLDGTREYLPLKDYLLRSRKGEDVGDLTQKFTQWSQQRNETDVSKRAQGALNVERNFPRSFTLMDSVNAEAVAMNKAISLFNKMNKTSVPSVGFRNLEFNSKSYTPGEFFTKEVFGQIPAKYKAATGNFLTEEAYADGVVKVVLSDVNNVVYAGKKFNARGTAPKASNTNAPATPKDITDDFDASMDSLVNPSKQTQQKDLQEDLGPVEEEGYLDSLGSKEKPSKAAPEAKEKEKPEAKTAETKEEPEAKPKSDRPSFKLEASETTDKAKKPRVTTAKAPSIRSKIAKQKKSMKSVKQWIRSLGGINIATDALYEVSDNTAKRDTKLFNKRSKTTLDNVIHDHMDTLKQYYPSITEDTARDTLQEALDAAEEVYKSEEALTLLDLQQQEEAEIEYYSSQMDLDFTSKPETKAKKNVPKDNPTATDTHKYSDTVVAPVISEETFAVDTSSVKGSFYKGGFGHVPDVDVEVEPNSTDTYEDQGFMYPKAGDILQPLSKSRVKELTEGLIQYLKGC